MNELCRVFYTDKGRVVEIAPGRIRAHDVAGMLGIGVRCVQQMACAGRLPGAAKIGKLWTFDPIKIRAYVADAEAKCQNPISIGAPESGGYEPPLPDMKSAKAYESAILKLLGSSGTRGLRNSPKRAPGSRRQAGRTP